MSVLNARLGEITVLGQAGTYTRGPSLLGFKRTQHSYLLCTSIESTPLETGQKAASVERVKVATTMNAWW